MTTQEIAERLVALCSKGDFETAQKELFADNAASIEPYATPDFEKETHGLEAILAKGVKFDSLVVEEMHSVKMTAPLVAGNSFATVMTMDMTMKGKGRINMSELCVYQVKDGKVVSEAFFM
jgi:ketosteroid isomerase-like protein